MKALGPEGGSLTLQVIDFGLILVDGEVGPGPAAVLVYRCPIKRSSRFLLCVMVAQRGRLTIGTDLQSQQCGSDRTPKVGELGSFGHRGFPSLVYHAKSSPPQTCCWASTATKLSQ